MFNLPYPLKTLSLGLQYITQYCHTFLSSSSYAKHVIAAAANGPSEAEATSKTPKGQTYGPSVVARAKSSPSNAWLQRIRIYREGLGRDSWSANNITKEFVSQSQRQVGKEGVFKYPMTIIFGLDDLAFNLDIVLEGLEQFFPAKTAVPGQGSQILRLPGQSHWFFTQARGAEIVEKALLGLLDGNGSGMKAEMKQEVARGEVEIASH